MNQIRSFFIVVIFSSCLQATNITWIAQSPSNDMSDAANWEPNSIPGIADVAVFNSSVSGVSTSPTESSAPFAVSALNFPNQASPFAFTFDNQRLAFFGTGITGAQTNPTLSFVNTNNNTYLGDVLSFAGAGTTGSSTITIANNAELTGAQSNQTLGGIGADVHSAGAYAISGEATITAQNIGVDSATALGGNSIAIGSASQIQCDDSFAGGNNVTISVENSGTYDGSNSAERDTVGLINGHQFVSTDAFEVGNNFSCSIENNGDASNTGFGNAQVAVINASQMGLQTTGIVGNDVSIAIANTGNNSSDVSVASDYVGYLNDNQLFVGQQFQAGDRFRLAVSNTGIDSSSGIGQGQVAVINNSGTTGDQVLFTQGGTFNNNAAIAVSNNGTYNGSNSGGGSEVAGTGLGQFTVGDSTSVGSYNFDAADNFNLAVANSGADSAVGTGGDAIGVISTNQTSFFSPCSLGDQATISIANQGVYSGSASATYVNVGSMGASQLNAASTFRAGDNFILNITNSGNNQGHGVGDFFIGDVINGQQASFANGCVLGNNGSITIANSGSDSSDTTSQNQVGSMIGYGKQFLVQNDFQAGDNLTVRIANSGYDNSSGTGGNYVGFINNNVADSSASQFHLANAGTVGNNASFAIVNNGIIQGDNTGIRVVGALSGQQFACVQAFAAGNQFSMDISQSGTSNSSGKNNSTIAGTNSQIDFKDDCAVGNDASFVISNYGTNNDASGTNNSIGYVGAAQMHVGGDFSGGTDLDININNSGINAGDGSNFVGYVRNSQLAFDGACILNDGSVINVANSGTVGNSQIVFNQGFDVASGKVTIQVTNQGTITDPGIIVQGANAGGNADIALNNSSLYIATSLANFTIGGLDGNHSSTAQSQPVLIINRDNSAQSNFAGVIQDFSDTVATVLVKTGAGTQILSGANSYTGTTTVQQGTLVINGSLASDALVNAGGILKGSGIINGTVTNMGTIAPGQSIGTMTVDEYNNMGGTYEVEVNGAGKSDLIRVVGPATISGGGVVVTPDDFNFASGHIYTIITAGSGVTGMFTTLSSSVPALMRLIYNPMAVQLAYFPVDAACMPCNARSAGSCFVGLAGTDATQIGNVLVLSSFDQIRSAFEQMSPSRFSGPTEVQLLDAILVRTTYTKHLQKLSFNQDQRSSFWIDGIAQWQKQSNAFGYKDTTVGGSIGLDFLVSDWVVGCALSLTNDNFHWRHFGGKAHIDSYYAGLYSRWQRDDFYLNMALIGAYNKYKTTRELCFVTVDRCAYSSHKGNEFLAHASYGHQMCQYGYKFTPYINLDYVWQHERGYNESGADSLNLQVKSKNSSLIQTEAGIYMRRSYQVYNGEFIPMLSLAYMNQTPCSNARYKANFASSCCQFSGRGGNYERNLFVPRLALTYQGKCNWMNASIYYDGQVGKGYWAQDCAIDLTFRF